MTTCISLLRTLFLTGKWLFYWFKLMTLTCPSVADFFFVFHFSDPLQLPLLAVADRICECSSDTFFVMWISYLTSSNWSYCRFYFHFFTYHPLQVLVFYHGQGHSLASFRPHYWCLIGLFCRLKLTTLTYPSFADSIFDILPFWPPVAPNTQQ